MLLVKKWLYFWLKNGFTFGEKSCYIFGKKMVIFLVKKKCYIFGKKMVIFLASYFFGWLFLVVIFLMVILLALFFPCTSYVHVKI